MALRVTRPARNAPRSRRSHTACPVRSEKSRPNALTLWTALTRNISPEATSSLKMAHGLQANTVGSSGSKPLSSGPVARVGLVQSGPRPAGSTGTEIIASGPALCSPLNGVGLLTSNPQGCASFGLLNQKPKWKVLVGFSTVVAGVVDVAGTTTSASNPKI